MKRPRHGLHWLLSLSLLLVLGQYLALAWWVPRHVVRALERIMGGSLSVERVRLNFPLTTTLIGLRGIANTPWAGCAIQQAVIAPSWISLPQRTIWVHTVELVRPTIRITRTKQGTMLWPSLMSSAEVAPSMTSSQWMIQINSLKIIDGVIEFIDEMPTPVFHGLFDHISLEIGPIVIPSDKVQTAFAVRGQLLGNDGHTAPLYCSGWTDTTHHDFQVSCQLEPLTLAALDPYFHGQTEVRVYTARLKLITQWMAQASDVRGKIHFELDQLSEGDLSVHGRTIFDIKRATSGQASRLSGELTLTGPLAQPAQWSGAFLPSNEQTQYLIGRLISRGVQFIRIPFGTTQLGISIALGNKAAMTDIEASSREIQEALELLAAPVPEIPAALIEESTPAEFAPAPPEVPVPESSTIPSEGASSIAPAVPLAPEQPDAPTPPPPPTTTSPAPPAP